MPHSCGPHADSDRVGLNNSGPLLLLLLALLLLLTASCESTHYGTALREDSAEAYLRFLARYPEGEHSEEARKRLERLRYWEARRADRPLAYNQYLQRYPNGTFAEACRKRLAGLALGRARTPADLELILERYPETEQAREAERRLPRLLAREALASNDPTRSQRFLARFQASPEAGAVREHLAALRYRGLPDRFVALEAFVDEYPGTPQAREALSRLERLLADAVLESRDPGELERFRARFPKSARLEELATLVRQEQRGRAIARLDLEALKGLPEDGDLLFLRRWCGARPRPCAALRADASRAAPWRPRQTPDELRRQAYAADPRQAWIAMDILAWSRTESAADLLLELVGSERLSTVWSAERALGAWLDGEAVGPRRRWIFRRLARAHRTANPDEAQRRAHLILSARGGDGEAALATLRGLAAGGSHQLAAAYLLGLWEGRRGPRKSVGRSTLARFTEAARARLKWLREAFPAELHVDSLFSAILAERELFALGEAMRVIRARGSAAGLDDVAHEADGLLVDWHRRLAGVSAASRTAKAGAGPASAPATFVPASVPSVREEVARHEQGRGAALKRVRAVGRAGKLVAAALCRRAAVAPPGCTQ